MHFHHSLSNKYARLRKKEFNLFGTYTLPMKMTLSFVKTKTYGAYVRKELEG